MDSQEKERLYSCDVERVIKWQLTLKTFSLSFFFIRCLSNHGLAAPIPIGNHPVSVLLRREFAVHCFRRNSRFQICPCDHVFWQSSLPPFLMC